MHDSSMTMLLAPGTAPGTEEELDTFFLGEWPNSPHPQGAHGRGKRKSLSVFDAAGEGSCHTDAVWGKTEKLPFRRK